MTSQLAPIMSAVPFVGVDSSGRPVRLHPDFIRWWAMQVEKRVGGTTASTNVELQQSITVLIEESGNLQGEVADLQNVPPPRPVVFPAPDEAPGVASLRARVAVLEKLVAQLHEGPTP